MAFNPNTFPYPPYSAPMTDQNGYLTPVWNKWFQQLWVRCGGANASPVSSVFGTPTSNLISALASAALSVMYTSPSALKTTINSFTVQNLDIVARTVSIYLVAQGATAGASNVVTSNLSIAAGATVTISGLQYQVLQSGGTIQVVAALAGVIQIAATGWVST